MTADRIHLYRTVGGFRWRRSAPGARSRWSTGAHRWKAALWRNLCRENPDWETCRIDDRTFTWRRPGGSPNLARQPTARTPRELPPISQARRRL